MEESSEIRKCKKVKDNKMQGKLKPNREYKDSVFVDLFSENMPFRCWEYVVAIYQLDLKYRDKFSAEYSYQLQLKASRDDGRREGKRKDLFLCDLFEIWAYLLIR